MIRFEAVLVLAAASLACGSGSGETACGEAERRLGHRVCTHSVPDGATWTAISFPARAVDQARSTVYMVPARDDARLPTLFVDASAFAEPEQSLHYAFLTESFPEMRLLSYDEYLELVLDPARREWFAGRLTELVVPGQEAQFGLTIADAGVDPEATISCAEMRTVRDVVDRAVGIGEVLFVPSNDLQRQEAAACDLPVYDASTALAYEVYTSARGCGTLRRFTLAALAAAEASADVGWQDVIVIDEAPMDLEPVVSGVVTGTRQGELSHLNVRSASRGTPNCYVTDAYELLARWQGRLVALECGSREATIEEITAEEAEACWEALRPEPLEVIPADLDFSELVGLLELPTESAAERRLGLARFGAKGENLATLYQRIDPALQLEGFLIPFRPYSELLAAATWSVDLGSGVETLSLAETIERWLADDVFLTDGAVRRAWLGSLRAAIRGAACDPAVVATVGAKISEVFGGDDVMVRFRSSSNAEDVIGFSGAGLYDSTSVCLADETDADTDGPSRCDPAQPEERDVCRGLTRVWSSLWNMKAFEERAWYGIDPRQVAMGILVDTRVDGELANVVAFTGNPSLPGDDRYLVNAQVGDLDVVSAVPGVWPEKDLLTIADGQVVEIERVRGSTELPEGDWVLDDARLEELGALLAGIAAIYPIDDEVSATDDVLFDTEWKLGSDGQLVIKQIRLFLR